MSRSVSKTFVLLGLCLSITHLAHADTEQCLIVVNGKTYLQGPCEVKADADIPGLFTVGVSDKSRSTHFAYIEPDDAGHTIGYWNADAADTHAQDPLGELTRSGSCWSNSHARICAEH